MKGVIADCLGKLVSNKFGKEKWQDSLELAGLPPYTSFLATQDIPDESIMKVIESVCKVLDINLQQAADVFGDYWMNDYAPHIYGVYYRQSKSAKQFLLNMDDVHRMTTENIPNAHPPRFTYEWEDDDTLIMNHESKRGLIVFLIGLIKGVGKYYKENLEVKQMGDNRVQVVFS